MVSLISPVTLVGCLVRLELHYIIGYIYTLRVIGRERERE